jgi:hypothetical protein
VPPCALLTLASGTAYPPRPNPNVPFKVRVTVSSTTNGFFAAVIGTNRVLPPPPSSDAGAACLRPQVKSGNAWTELAGAAGSTTCAQAVATIRGSSIFLGKSPIIPPTTGDCQIASETNPEAFFQLWGSNPAGCGYRLGSWKNVLDFTYEPLWCDNQAYDYRYINLLPPQALVDGGFCDGQANDTTWNRADFVKDPQWPGNNDAKSDIPYWIARGFGGKLRGCTWQWNSTLGKAECLGDDGIRFPTYIDTHPANTGDMGQNIAAGFYCGSAGESGRHLFPGQKERRWLPPAGLLRRVSRSLRAALPRGLPGRHRRDLAAAAVGDGHRRRRHRLDGQRQRRPRPGDGGTPAQLPHLLR